MIRKDKVKCLFIHIILLLSVLCSCDNSENMKNNQKEVLDNSLNDQEEKVLDEILIKDVERTEYLDAKCLNKFESAFLFANVWPDSTVLEEACFFYPKPDNVKQNQYPIENYNYIAFFVSYNSEYIYELYAIHKVVDIFFPIRFESNTFYHDTIFSVDLYFETPIDCKGVKIKGAKEKDKNKIGIFKKINSPKLNKYVDSILEGR